MNWSTRQVFLAIAALLLGVAVLGGAGYLMYSVSLASNADSEVKTSLLVVSAIAVLMTVLFILASGFRFLDLADPRQPLGLPEGSIRAMIALVLIMIFIIFGIYLFRMVGTGNQIFIGSMDAPPKPDLYPGKILSVYPDEAKKKYNVFIINEITTDGLRLAQQLLTTVGTLVVAVSGFYFGSSTGTSSKNENNIKSIEHNPRIVAVVPDNCIVGQTIDLEIAGSGFDSPKSVFLKSGDGIIQCSNILSSSTKIICKVLVNKLSAERLDVVVQNNDGTEATLPRSINTSA